MLKEIRSNLDLSVFCENIVLFYETLRLAGDYRNIFKGYGITSMIFIDKKEKKEVDAKNIDDALFLLFKSDNCEVIREGVLRLSPILYGGSDENFILFPRSCLLCHLYDIEFTLKKRLQLDFFLKDDVLLEKYKIFLQGLPCRYLNLDKLNNLFPVKSFGNKEKLLGLPKLEIVSDLTFFGTVGGEWDLGINYKTDELHGTVLDMDSLKRYIKKKVGVYAKVSFEILSFNIYTLRVLLNREHIGNFIKEYMIESNVYDGIKYYKNHRGLK